jgi:hypothetical protein
MYCKWLRKTKEVEPTKTDKRGGKYTEPNLPPKTIAEGNGVELKQYYKSGDHAPAHIHVIGGGEETRIG